MGREIQTVQEEPGSVSVQIPGAGTMNGVEGTSLGVLNRMELEVKKT